MAAGDDGGFEEVGDEACGGAKTVRHTSHWEGRCPCLVFDRIRRLAVRFGRLGAWRCGGWWFEG